MAGGGGWHWLGERKRHEELGKEVFPEKLGRLEGYATFSVLESPSMFLLKKKELSKYP